MKYELLCLNKQQEINVCLVEIVGSVGATKNYTVFTLFFKPLK